jgi:ribosomal protein S18 acetylase RimI-like enzyme
MMPHRCRDPYDWPALLDLIRAAFAYMEGRIDPPSSMNALSVEKIAQQAEAGEVWAIGTPPVACVFLTPKPDVLYVGKLAVAANQRGKGHARALIDLAETRALALNLPALELETRVELTENHAIFRAMGFAETGRSAHAGFDRPTSITFRRGLVG